MTTLFHDSRNENYRYPFGARPAGASVLLRLGADQAFERAWLRTWFIDTETIYEMDRRGNAFEIELHLPEKPGLFWYYFIAEDGAGRRLLYGNDPDNLGGKGQSCAFEPPSFQITLYDYGKTVPDWMHESALYHIFPDRFHSSGKKDPSVLGDGRYYHKTWNEYPDLNMAGNDNAAIDFFGGDLRGITEKLPYLKDLGIGCIYLNPIFRARSNHKYDTGCYMQVDPSFGTEEDLKTLCAKAAELGIHILLDGVFSHTGSDSLYFDRFGRYGNNGAYCRQDSPYASWYTFKQWPDSYECWWGFETLPNVNENDPAYRDYIIENDDAVLPHWLRAGISGWRLDVADELPMDFLKALRRRVKDVKTDAAIIGEVWEDASRKEAYGQVRCYCSGDTLDGTMNYPVRDAVMGFLLGSLSAYQAARALESQRENYPYPFLYSCMNLLGSHDKPRAISVLAGLKDLDLPTWKRHPLDMTDEEYTLGKERYRAAMQFIACIPGMPSVYYGDEAGLTGMADPYCRAPYPWGHEDEELRCQIGSILSGRQPVCKTGDCIYAAASDDVLMVGRYFRDGLDVFGKARSGPDMALCLMNRSSETVKITVEPGDIDGMPLTKSISVTLSPHSSSLVYPM